MVVGSMRGGFHDPVTRAWRDLGPMLDRFNESSQGVLVGVAPSPPTAGRPIGFFQSNQSRFYREHHKAGWFGGKIWRDFYFAGFYELLSQLDQLGSSDLLIYHPNVGSLQWSFDMQCVVLDVLAHLADRRWLNARRVYLGCVHEMNLNSLARAAYLLNAERETVTASPFRELGAERVDLPGIPLAVSRSATVWQVDAFASRASRSGVGV